MSSSQQLCVGAKGTYSNISARWLKYNTDTGRSIHTAQNTQKPKARYFSVCYTSPTSVKVRKEFVGCNAHLKAVGSDRDNMEVLSVDYNHTCSREVKRKRNYATKEIVELSDVLKLYEPATAGNVRQYQKMAKTSTGVNIKIAQAHSAVKSKCHDSIEAQIGQYLLLPSLIERYTDEDSGGTYRLVMAKKSKVSP